MQHVTHFVQASMCELSISVGRQNWCNCLSDDYILKSLSEDMMTDSYVITRQPYATNEICWVSPRLELSPISTIVFLGIGKKQYLKECWEMGVKRWDHSVYTNKNFTPVLEL